MMLTLPVQEPHFGTDVLPEGLHHVGEDPLRILQNWSCEGPWD